MKGIACLISICIATVLPAQSTGVTHYGAACGDINLSAAPARAGHPLRMVVNVHTNPLMPGHGALGIGFNQQELPIGNFDQTPCSLLISPAVVVPVSFTYHVRLVALVGDLTLLEEIPASLVGMRLFFQSAYENRFGTMWSNGAEVRITE